MNRKVSILLVLLLLLSIMAGCTSKQANTEQINNVQQTNKLTIYTTFYPMYFLASEIAGNKAEIINLTPAGAEPHDWEPTPKTIANMQKGSMFIYNGAGMEIWADKVIDSLKAANVKVVCASDGLELISHDKEEVTFSSDSADHEHGLYDPHLWVSPEKYIMQAKNILQGFLELDSSNKDFYEGNYNELVSKLSKLDSDIKEAVEGFKSKVIVTSHDAFGYFSHDYGLTQIPIRGVSPDSEPSPAKMAELVEKCREYNVKYVFFEKLVSPKLSETLANEVGADTMVLNAASGIDNSDIEAGKNYITIMYENLDNLKRALGGQDEQ